MIERLKRFGFRDFVALVAFAMSAYQVTVGYLGEPVAEVHRPVHVLLALLILFWSSERSAEPWKRRLQFTSDMVLSLVLIAASA